jgi:hypothetical protein
MLEQAASEPEVVDSEVRGAGWKFSEYIFEPVKNSVALAYNQNRLCCASARRARQVRFITNHNGAHMIYVLSPANFATGGTELLHQFGRQAIDLGAEACMLYLNASSGINPVHERFYHYDVPYSTDFGLICSDDVVVFPEIYTNLVHQTPARIKAVWWLSVGNYKPRHALRKRMIDWFRGRKELDLAELGIRHYVQSDFAREFIVTNGASFSGYLSDYLSADFINGAANVDMTAKRDIIVYNPKKGMEFTKQVMAAAPNFEFVPIQGMTPAQVADLLAAAKVYIDFGSHPGKDRIPREAAIMGCCVLVGAMGSAANAKDVPIPSRFKFAMTPFDVKSVVLTLEKCLEDFSVVSLEFDTYKQMIRHEECDFRAQVTDFINSL